MNAYSPSVWQRFTAPAHAGMLAPRADVYTGRADTPGADAVVELDLRVADQRIGAAAFRVYGCPAAVASADWLCMAATGLATADATAIAARDIESALALAPEKRFCGLLAVDALAAALALAAGPPITSNRNH